MRTHQIPDPRPISPLQQIGGCLEARETVEAAGMATVRAAMHAQGDGATDIEARIPPVAAVQKDNMKAQGVRTYENGAEGIIDVDAGQTRCH